MSGFGMCFVSIICLLVFLTGRGSAGQPSYPTNPNDPYYQAFQNVPSANATAKKFMTNFLRIPYWTISPAQRWLTERRDFEIEFNVVVMDGSGSVAVCEFEKGKKALKYMMDEMHNPNLVDANYAAVTFSTSAKVNFRFLQYSTAASEILNIPYPGDSTNTQAGLAEAKKLFDYVPFSGGRLIYTRTVLLVTDGQSNVQTHLTIPNAQALKNNNVTIFVVAVGSSISGIDELVKVASYPPDQHIFRVDTHSGFLEVVKLVLKEISPDTWVIVSGQSDPPC